MTREVYRESVNDGVAMSQLRVEPERMANVFGAGAAGSSNGRKRRSVRRGKGSRAKAKS